MQEVKSSDKLLKLMVDLGDHKRSILAAMNKKSVSPAEIEGQRALIVIDVESRKMAREIFLGIVFAIGYADGIMPVLAIPESSVPNGARVG